VQRSESSAVALNIGAVPDMEKCALIHISGEQLNVSRKICEFESVAIVNSTVAGLGSVIASLAVSMSALVFKQPTKAMLTTEDMNLIAMRMADLLIGFDYMLWNQMQISRAIGARSSFATSRWSVELHRGEMERLLSSGECKFPSSAENCADSASGVILG
jgi:hypothetical protein